MYLPTGFQALGCGFREWSIRVCTLGRAFVKLQIRFCKPRKGSGKGTGQNGAVFPSGFAGGPGDAGGAGSAGAVRIAKSAR